MTSRDFVRLLIGLCLMFAVAACAAASKPASQASEPASARTDGEDGLGMGRASSAHQEIEALWADIESQRRRGGMLEPLSSELVESMSDRPVLEVRDSCQPPDELSTTCQDVCTLGDSICDNAASICRLADDLGDDAWARGKCDGAKAACAQAKERCCDCS